MVTIDQALREATATLSRSGIENARFEAEIILGHVLERDRSYLRAWGEHALTDDQFGRFAALVERRAEGEPVAYILGEKEFWSLRLQVSPATLIPRPETELLVEQALTRIPEDAQWCLADLGTGTGAVALALAKERPECLVVATDSSAAALDVARANARVLSLENVEFRLGVWWEPVVEQRCDVIVSNPPYVRAGDAHLDEGDVRFEPHSALLAGADGLSALRAIVGGAPVHLRRDGWLIVEHGYDQAESVATLFRATGFSLVAGYTDLAGQARVTAGQWRRD